MSTLRWLLAIGILMAGIGFGAFVLFANNFRRSFGASENPLFIAAIPVVLSLTLAWWLVRKSATPLPPEALSYPILLVEENRIIEVCLNVEELTFRPENQDHVIEQRFHVVDATGARFRIENYRVIQPKPSTLGRIFSATVFDVKRFKVAFELRRDGTLGRDEVITQLRDRDWKLPADAASAPFGDLYLAYRADRFREFRNARDRIPDTLPQAQANP
jgi:hypothetical protein